MRYVVAPVLGLAMCVWLWTSLSSRSLVLGLLWVLIGAAWLAYLTRGFRRPPPELSFTD